MRSRCSASSPTAGCGYPELASPSGVANNILLGAVDVAGVTKGVMVTPDGTIHYLTDIAAVATMAVGGDLAGNLPNPTLAPATVTNAHLAEDIERTNLDPPDAWTVVEHDRGAAPAFDTGWSSNAGYPTTAFSLDEATELVTLRGVCLAGAGVTTNVFTLPTGYRPPARFDCIVGYFDVSLASG